MNELISQLSSNLKLTPEKAEAASGAILGLIQEKAPVKDFQALLGVLPETAGWIVKAHALAGAPPAKGSAGLPTVVKLSSLLGGTSTPPSILGLTGVLGVLGKLGIEPTTAARLVPPVLTFLQGKLGKLEFDRIAGTVPFINEALSGGFKGAASRLIK